MNYTREQLLLICEASIVPQQKWSNRDTPSAHENIGLCWAMLKAGCNFKILEDAACNLCTDDKTIWLEISWRNFNSFEYEEGSVDSETFYLPTLNRLKEVDGDDWY